jgi:hypothetical protein
MHIMLLHITYSFKSIVFNAYISLLILFKVTESTLLNLTVKRKCAMSYPLVNNFVGMKNNNNYSFIEFFYF